jgi:hypothetical protein
MEVSCRLPVCVISSVSFTDWFNVSHQETWGFDLSFRKGDHKAVMRRDPPRLEKPLRRAKMTNYLVITTCYLMLVALIQKSGRVGPF